MRPLVLTSADNPRVKSVVKLRDNAARRKAGLFIAEGQREIQRAVQANLKLVELYDCPTLTKHQWPAWDILIPDEAVREGAQWYEVNDALLCKMAYKDRPEGALGIFEQPRWSWEEIAAVTQSTLANKSANEPVNGSVAPPLYLVAVGLAKPGNLGAMARSAAAAGVTALLVADGVVDAFNPNAVRASTGAVFSLPILGDTSSRIRTFLNEQRVPFYAASPDGKLTYTQANLKGPAALVIGAEDTGLDETWLTHGTPITIPMNTQKVDSLNASIAAGVLLFEAVRQRMG